MKSVSYMQQGKHSASQGTDPSDGILLGQSLTGDEYAFEALVSRYRGPLLTYIRRILKDDEQAYDVLQLVLLRLYISQPRLRTDVPLQAWLFQVAREPFSARATWVCFQMSIQFLSPPENVLS